MSQRRKFLSTIFSDTEITTIIERELELPSTPAIHSFSYVINHSTRFTFIDPQGSTERPITKSDLAEIRKCHQKGETALVTAEPTSMPGHNRRARIGYSDIRADEGILDQIKKEIGRDTESHVSLNSKPNDQNELPLYLDHNHPNFSTELYTAIMAWQALYGDKDKALPNIGVETRMTKWLKDEKFQTHGKEVVKRIATVITPNYMKTKRGTKPTIQSKKTNGSPIEV